MKTSNYLDPERLAKLQKRIWDVATAAAAQTAAVVALSSPAPDFI